MGSLVLEGQAQRLSLVVVFCLAESQGEPGCHRQKVGNCMHASVQCFSLLSCIYQDLRTVSRRLDFASL